MSKDLNTTIDTRCLLAASCPFMDIGGTTFPMCEHVGYDAKEAARLKGCTPDTIRGNSGKYFGRKLGKFWHFPRCGVLQHLPYDVMDENERISLMRFKANLSMNDYVSNIERVAKLITPNGCVQNGTVNIAPQGIKDRFVDFIEEASEKDLYEFYSCQEMIWLMAIDRVLTGAEVYLRAIEIKAEKLLQNASQYENEQILNNMKSKIYDSANALVSRIIDSNLVENQELAQLLYTSELRAKDFVNRDREYRQVAVVINGSNIGFTEGDMKYYGTNNPFMDTYKYFMRQYRTGNINWHKLRKQVIEERGYKCEICSSSEKIHVHHQIDSITNDIESLQVLCEACHRKKHKTK